MMQAPKLELTTAPGAELFAAADLASWIGASASDPLLEGLIVSARQMAESYLGMGFITQTWKQFYDLNAFNEDWWDGVRQGAITELSKLPECFKLARWPVDTVTHVKFSDEAGTLTTADSDSYYISTVARPPEVVLKDGYTWPQLIYRVRDAVEIQFDVGYGAAGSDVPTAIVSGVKALAAFLYEHRGECEVNAAIKNSGAAEYFRPYRVMKI